ncbi:hypothetical protein [Aestuariirhabdus litorea]|uniref:Uncharacterized protein n=1 Tax=Aestuariirhabdus litorea TaxID=2528527 RepID=A0A3P3VPQ2_9GAMM|nr:hypothetical protein [Aestuariirhabdus litorea]RRJ84761.1 hypothetical protein D0544_06585 [Aestuariirhabdus litorea]RWW97985.1 hypothetical protein DZC74_06580 [Endozoicomonadaceae bacterium GTF-13]
MSKLSMGGRFIKQEELEAMEQQRLAALLEITEKHNTQVAELTAQLEDAQQQAERASEALQGEKRGAAQRLRALEDELKSLRALNPERMKKQNKRLQEQNRALTADLNAQKGKNKQLNEQVKKLKIELEQASQAADQEPAQQVA